MDRGYRRRSRRQSGRSGAANEVWRYGEEVLKICERYMRMREEMRDYSRRLMQETHEKGPVIKTLFYEFPEDKECWAVECYS